MYDVFPNNVKPAGPIANEEFTFKRALKLAVPPAVNVPAEVTVVVPLKVTAPEPVRVVVERPLNDPAPLERICAAAVDPVGT